MIWLKGPGEEQDFSVHEKQRRSSTVARKKMQDRKLSNALASAGVLILLPVRQANLSSLCEHLHNREGAKRDLLECTRF